MAKNRIWQVNHPELGTVWVTAESWEKATVEAARLYGVPWGKVVAELTCERSCPAMRHICQRCKRIFNGEGAMCSACELVLETEREQTKQRLMKTWYLGGEEGALRNVRRKRA